MFYRDLPKDCRISVSFVSITITRLYVYIGSECVYKGGYEGLAPHKLTPLVQTLHKALIYSNTADEIKSSINTFTNSISTYRFK